MRSAVFERAAAPARNIRPAAVVSSPVKLLLLLFAPALVLAQPTPDLAEALAAEDARFFGAYNRCDLDVMRGFFVPGDLEFFHDNSGLETSVDALLESTERNICGQIRRELVPGTLETHPLPGYGAVQTGVHRFHHVDSDEVGEAKFLHIWKRVDGEWKMTRVVSYDH